MAGPIDKKRWGNIEVALWDGQMGKTCSAQVSVKEGENWVRVPLIKSYKTKEGDFKTSKTLFASDLRRLAALFTQLADSIEEGKTREPVDIGDSRQMDFEEVDIPF